VLDTLEQLMTIDFHREDEKVRPCYWIEAMLVSHIRQAAASGLLHSRFKRLSEEQRQYFLHVMDEGVIAIEEFRKRTCPRCERRLAGSVPSYYRKNVELCSCGED